jgi:serine/threonine-protein kinase
VDGRADLFATGAMLYEMLTGRKPFPGRDAAEIMAGILHREPVEPAELGVDLPWGLEAALRRAMAKRADDRFATAAEFKRALDLDEFEAPEPDEAPTVPRSARPETPRRENWDERTLRKVEADLVRHVGPVARVLVKQAASSATSLGDLYKTLAPHIGDAGERTLFLRKGGSTAAGSPPRALDDKAGGAAPPLRLPPEQIAAAQDALMHCLGPVARVLVKQALAQATSPRDFYERLSAHIQREEDRLAFRRKLSRDWGPDLRR